jgi:putative toxin-antitoxin system antitoxin component (TIGR02293 family)
MVYENFIKPSVVNEPAVAYLTPNDWLYQPLDYHTLIGISRDGIKASQLEKLRISTGLEVQQLARILQVTSRTLQNKKGNDKFSISVSEKALELSQLYLRGYDVFGSPERFKSWMLSNVLALNNDTPLSYLDTQFGFDLVLQVLGRIEHGVFS